MPYLEPMSKKLRVHGFPIVDSGEIGEIKPTEETTKLLTPLSVGLDMFDVLTMWVLVEEHSSERHWFPNVDPKPIRYLVVNTRENVNIPENATFVGSVRGLGCIMHHVFTVGI